MSPSLWEQVAGSEFHVRKEEGEGRSDKYGLPVPVLAVLRSQRSRWSSLSSLSFLFELSQVDLCRRYLHSLSFNHTRTQHQTAMRLLTPILLLAATLTTSLAKPLPVDMDEIQRRWSQGESEVCCTPSVGPGCYISAWFQSLGKRRGKGVRLPVCSLPLAQTSSRTATIS